MILEELSLSRFRHLDGCSYAFGPGLNVLRGPNEAGKSSLQDAILFAMFGNPRHTTLERLLPVERYITWGRDAGFALQLRFVTADGERYELHKDWGSGMAALRNLDSDTEVTDLSRVQNHLLGILGCDSLTLARSTICVRQDALEDLAAGESQVGDRLQHIVTGGGENEESASRVLQSLEQEIKKLTRAGQKDPGPIRVLKNRMEESKLRLSILQPQVEGVRRAVEQCKALKEAIASLEKKLEEARNTICLCDKYLQVQVSLAAALERERQLQERLSQIRATVAELLEREAEAIRLGGVAAIDPRLAERLADLKARALGPEDRQSGAAAPSQLGVQRGAKTHWNLVALMGLVVAIVGGLLIASPGGARRGLGLAFLAGGLAALVLAGAALARVAQERGSIIAALTGLAERLSALLEGRDLNSWREELKNATRERRDLEAILEQPDMKRVATLGQEEMERLRQEMTALERELAENQRELAHNEGVVEAGKPAEEEFMGLEEELEDKQRQLGILERRVQLYQLTHDVLKQAVQETMRRLRDELQLLASKHMAQITAGRYRQVFCSDELDLSVAFEEGDEPIDIDSLSRGTVDQLYFAVRLALVELIFGEAKPPLLLDDPFVTFDARRRSEALALCRRLAGERQVLLFTCSEEYDSFAERVISISPADK